MAGSEPRRRQRTAGIVLLAVISAVSIALASAFVFEDHPRQRVASPATSSPFGGPPVAPPPLADQQTRRRVHDSIVSGRLLFVGASYSIGLGATRAKDAFPDLVAARLDDPFSVDAVAGTGFQNAGSRHQGTFAQRLARDSPLLSPRLIVIQGGRDDVGFPSDREYGAVLATIRLAQRRFPDAQVVVLGPIPAYLPVTPAQLAIRDAIAHAALAAGAGFIDPIAERWITPQNEHGYVGRIPGHPNDAGYAYITNRLIQELPAALKQAKPSCEKAHDSVTETDRISPSSGCI